MTGVKRRNVCESSRKILTGMDCVMFCPAENASQHGLGTGGDIGAFGTLPRIGALMLANNIAIHRSGPSAHSAPIHA
jgi:hypothetical protein